MTSLKRQQDQKFKEFQRHLSRRHRQNTAHRRRTNQPLVDAHAERLGRYLRAARLNANLSPAALAERTKLTTDTILALEQGVILRYDIKTTWLTQLAVALNEDIEDLKFLAGPIGRPHKERPQLNLADWVRSINKSVPRFVYTPLLASLLCVMVSAALLVNVKFPFIMTDGGTIVYVTPTSLVAPELSPASSLTLVSAYENLNPADRLSLLRAERLMPTNKAGEVQRVSTRPPVIETNPVTHLLLADALDTTPIEKQPRIKVFYDIVYWLTVGRTVQLEGRPSMISAEYRLENQILVLPKVIDVDSEDRLNMIKAEVKL